MLPIKNNCFSLKNLPRIATTKNLAGYRPVWKELQLVLNPYILQKRFWTIKKKEERNVSSRCSEKFHRIVLWNTHSLKWGWNLKNWINCCHFHGQNSYIAMPQEQCKRSLYEWTLVTEERSWNTFIIDLYKRTLCSELYSELTSVH